jgi:hypothetical protein
VNPALDSNESTRGPAGGFAIEPPLSFQARVRWPTARGPDGGVAQGLRDQAQWDSEAGVWWCSNDELPLTTEARTFEQLVQRVLEIAPEIAAENGLAMPGDEIELHVVGERVEAVPVIGAA